MSLRICAKAASGETDLLALEYGSGKVSVGDISMPVSPNEYGVSTVEIWLDGSVAEILVDSREVLTHRSYAQPAKADKLFLRWKGNPEGLKELRLSGVRAISADRLTT